MAHLEGIRKELIKLHLDGSDIDEILEIVSKKLLLKTGKRDFEHRGKPSSSFQSKSKVKTLQTNVSSAFQILFRSRSEGNSTYEVERNFNTCNAVENLNSNCSNGLEIVENDLTNAKATDREQTTATTTFPVSIGDASFSGVHQNNNGESQNDAAQHISEMIESEKKYVESLKSIIENWLVPFRNISERDSSNDNTGSNSGNELNSGILHTSFQNTYIISKTDVLNIFSNIEILYNLHCDLFKEIQESTIVDIGCILRKRSLSMSIYSQYVNNWSNATATLQRLKEAKILETFSKNSDLEELLSKPLKRIEFYSRKLKEILKVCTLTASSKSNIEEAIKNLDELTSSFLPPLDLEFHLASIKHVKHNLTNFTDELAVPGRKFLREGDLYVFQNAKENEKKLFHFFLFSDLLIYAEKLPSQQYRCKGSMNLRKCTVITRSQRFSIAPLAETLGTSSKVRTVTNTSSMRSPMLKRSQKPSNATDLKNSIRIVNENENESEMLTFTAMSFPERDVWAHDLERITTEFYQKRVFGIPLKELCQRTYQNIDGIPIFLKLAFDSFDEQALKIEGLFRLSPSHLQVSTFKDTIDQGTFIDFQAKPHVVANLIKLFFRELPDPLIPFSNYGDFANLANDQSLDVSGKVYALYGLLKKLPDYNFGILKQLIAFLVKVSSYSEYNKMNAKNLGIVFDPNILRKKVISKNGDDYLLAVSQSTFGLTATMINNYQTLFP